MKYQRTVSLALLLAASGCALTPKLQRPVVSTPTDWRWKAASPNDEAPRGDWWTAFNDATLNELEARAATNNQSLKSAFARVEQARAIARVSKADFYPSLNGGANYTRFRTPENLPGPLSQSIPSITADWFSTPLDLSYEIDLFGRVRNSFRAAQAQAEAGVASYRTALTTLTADVAANYFLLRQLDAEMEILERGIQLRRDALAIVEARAKSGLTSEADSARARTELAAVQAEATDIQRRRAELEHALAVLCGEPASTFAVAARTTTPAIPEIPVGLPSSLLERRSDVAEAERQLAAACAQIGVAKAAFFPVVRLTGSGGFASADLDTLFNWESRVWTIGPSIAFPIFQGGRNRANLAAAKARHEELVGAYRQRVLVAFKEVEDALADLKFRAEQSEHAAQAVASATQSTQFSNDRYTRGLVNYLEVVDSQRTQLQAERAAAQVHAQRLVSSVLLVKALGGGWEKPDGQPQLAQAKPAR